MALSAATAARARGIAWGRSADNEQHVHDKRGEDRCHRKWQPRAAQTVHLAPKERAKHFTDRAVRPYPRSRTDEEG